MLTRQTPDGSLLLYCSPHCRSEAQSLELQLKTGPPAAVLRLFKQHADATGNRFFILAAVFIYAIVNRLKRNGGDLEEAAQPFEYMATRPYWETVDLPEDQDPAALRHEMLSQTEESLGMLRELFADELRQFPGLEAKFFTTSAYSLLLGGLNLNTISIKVPSPLVPYFLMLDALPHEHRRDAVHALSPFLTPLLERQDDHDHDHDDHDHDHDAHECCVRVGDLGNSGRREHREDEDEDDDEENEGENDEEDGDDDVESEDGEEEEDEGEEDEFEFDWTAAAADGVVSPRRCKFTSGLFPPYKGYAFFPLLSTLNHSCEPNCQVAYLEDGQALVFALRDIAAGEELSISYIYRHLPLAERQQQLRSYGFVCACPRCAADAQAQEAPDKAEAGVLPAAIQEEEEENRAPEEGEEKSNDGGAEHSRKRRRTAPPPDHHHRRHGDK